MFKELPMQNKSLIFLGLLLMMLAIGAIFQACVKPGDSTGDGSTTGSEEPEFTLSGEAI